MSNPLKKNPFSLGIQRLFTRSGESSWDLIHFNEPEEWEDEPSLLSCPDNWSAEAASLLGEAVCKSIPAQSRTKEENTVPSWLWRRTGEGRNGTHETSAQQVFDRVVGSAAYVAWKLNLFSDETEARNFFDEARYALAQRYIALEPARMANLGVEWAYGFRTVPIAANTANKSKHIEISNAAIDAVVSGKQDKNIQPKWQKALLSPTPTNFQFTDISSDWGLKTTSVSPAMIDLMALRHNDGSLNIDALRHATQLLVILLDIHDPASGGLSLGYCNLAPLLMALAVPYDSDAARSLAAGISAVMTAEAYATSAKLAALRGPHPLFNAHRESALRSLRNHRRAAYGDRNDYEKISVLPVPLKLDQCPDLTLVATAQRCWDDTLELARQHGLRHVQVTELKDSSGLMLFMESLTQGIQPVSHLMLTRMSQEESFQIHVAPFVSEALARLNYDKRSVANIVAHIAGVRSLEKAPAINHASLRSRGLTDEAIRKIEDYLPQVNKIRLAFTPWVLGEDYCLKVLKIQGNDILAELGFSDTDINAANRYCYGTHSARSAAELQLKHATLFACGDEIPAEARIRMAAAVQSFISSTVALTVSLALGTPLEKSEKLLLSAWRQGIKGMNLVYDAQEEAVSVKKQSKTKLAAFLHTQKPSLPARRMKTAKASRTLTAKPASSKSSSGKTRGKH
ncbi:MAG: hypothetical protein WAO98_01530 [Alphaproteobacteria bacterium]